jgi:ABC-2 type transport system permease protein
MGLYSKIISTSFKSNAAYKFNFYMSTFFGFIMLVLKISIWQALYAAKGGASLSGVSLDEMIAYNIIVAFSGRFVSSNVMNDINDMVVNGEIAQRLLLPLGFRRHMFLSTLSSNVFWTLYSAIPPTLVAVAIYGLKFSFEPLNLLCFFVSLLLAMMIGFLIDFVFGIVVFWFKNAFFLDWMRGAFFSLFSGSFVPMWFFPGWLNTLGWFLPFRYVVYEPTAILLGKYAAAGILQAIISQVIWIAALFLLGEFVWRKAQKRVFSQGG